MKTLRVLIAVMILTAGAIGTAVPVQASALRIEARSEAPATAPVPSLMSKSGSGSKVLKFRAQSAPTIAKITNKGGGNFAVISYKGTAYDDLLVNQIGSYAGQVYLAPGVNLLKLTSSGSWSVDIKPYTAARRWNGKSTLTGKGDTVVLLSGGAFGATTIKNKSRSNFAVIAYGTDGEYLDLLVNEIGIYSGEVLLPDTDPMILAIHDVGGAWSFSQVE